MRQQRYRFFYGTDELKLVKEWEVALRPWQYCERAWRACCCRL